MAKLSAVLCIHNEERRLGRCLGRPAEGEAKPAALAQAA
jgi:hypothetical protein